MKVSKIEIKDFHQFEDLTIDLTFPAGHEKAGQPLDKVCIIGQSGTGKTSILEMLIQFISGYSTHMLQLWMLDSLRNKVFVEVHFGHNGEYSSEASYQNSKTFYGVRHVWDKYRKAGQPVSDEGVTDEFQNAWINNAASKLMYLPSNLSYDIVVDLNTTFDEKPIIDFSVDKVAAVWSLVLDKIQAYQEQELRIRQEISKTVEQASNNLETIQKALKKLADWKQTEFNPIQDIADNCLDKLLAHFKLRVKTELDIKTKEDIGFIKVEDFDGNEIPHGLWSTGTKQVILSALPLYLLKPKQTMIFFDEPERSLYPDMQRFIIDYYSSLAESCQFFYATHSPIIASSFDPWEIVELKFNTGGKIYRELYYEGDNHVDNYKYNPRFMRWDDILQRIFDMENDGSQARKEKLDELARLNVQYKKLKKEGKTDTAKASAILQQIDTLSKLLSAYDNTIA